MKARKNEWQEPKTNPRQPTECIPQLWDSWAHRSRYSSVCTPILSLKSSVNIVTAENILWILLHRESGLPPRGKAQLQLSSNCNITVFCMLVEMFNQMQNQRGHSSPDAVTTSTIIDLQPPHPHQITLKPIPQKNCFICKHVSMHDQQISTTPSLYLK